MRHRRLRACRHHTDIGKEHFDLCTQLEHEPEQARAFTLSAVHGSWLDDDKRRLTAEFDEEIDALVGEHAR